MYTVALSAGVNSSQLNILITNDNILEDNETFNLTINQSSLPDGVVVGDPSQVTVTIVDDDGEGITLYSKNVKLLILYKQLESYIMHYVPTDITISFNQSSYSVDEDKGPAQPVLVLSNPSSTDIIVAITDMSGSGNDMPRILSGLMSVIKYLRRNG